MVLSRLTAGSNAWCEAAEVSRQGTRCGQCLAGDVGVIVTAVDETWSLRETIDTLLSENAGTVAEIVIGIAPHTTAECRAVIVALEAAYPDRVRHHEQARLTGAGGANRECIPLMRSSWLMIMAADLETHPGTAAAMIARAGLGEVDIVATSRWLGGGRFGDYSRMKRVCNWLFQRFFFDPVWCPSHGYDLRLQALPGERTASLPLARDGSRVFLRDLGQTAPVRCTGR